MSQQNVETPFCPRCGGDTVLRNGRLGKFYGCREYPRCRGSVDFAKHHADEGDDPDPDEADHYYDAFIYDAGDR